MPVEDVFKPKTLNPVDPRTPTEKDEAGDEYWVRKAREAKARLDYQEYEHAMRQMGQTPEPPFRVSGSVNLGNIDFQEQQRKANEAAENARQTQEAQLREERDKRQQVEQALYNERVEGLRRDFNTRIAELNATVEKLATAPRRDERSILQDFQEQFSSLQAMAKEFGFARTGDGQDPLIQLELAKLSMQQAREEREFKRQMRDDEKKWQIELQKLQDSREIERARLHLQSKRDDMLAALPEHIGGAMARGLIDRGQSAPAPAFANAQQPSQATVPTGQLASVPCPQCKSPIAIAPDTSIATCAMCNAQFQIRRKSSPGAAAPANNEEAINGEEEQG